MRLEPLYYAHPFSSAVMPVNAAFLAETYLASKPADWDLAAALDDPRAPWAESMAVAEDTVVASVDLALRGLMMAVPTLNVEDLLADRLPESRARRHLMALKDVWQRRSSLPLDLAAFKHVLESTAQDALAPMPLLSLPPDPFASAAEAALEARLYAHHGPAPEAALRDHLARRPQRAEHGNLAHIQRGLLERRPPVERDATLRFYTLRDSLQEARFAAALARRMLEDGRAGKLSDIALLLPDDPLRLAHVIEAFAAQGLPLSGLPGASPRRDIAGEIATLALQVLRQPAPAMALASLATQPLMPWSKTTGAALARELMRGRYAPRLAENLTGRAADLWQALQGGAASARQLAFKLGFLAESLTAEIGQESALQDARGRLRLLQSMSSEGEPDWATLAKLAQPGTPQIAPPDRLLEGISLLGAAELPWRGARHLIVTGFAAGEYPRAGGASAFFLDSERAMIRAAIGLDLPGRGAALARGLALFGRQIGAASESVTFLSPQMDGQGKSLALPLTFSLIAVTLSGGEKGLVQDIGAISPELWPVANFPVPALPEPFAPLPEGVQIALGRDLLRLHENEAGHALPQSPSRLETLLVSPLAWALGELDAVDVPWTPEDLTIMLKGTLAHHVLEHVFPVSGTLPATEGLEADVARHYADGIRKNAPFLAASQWQMERETLFRETLRAVRIWLDILLAEGAEVLLNEVRLEGEAHGITIKGRADAVLRLGDGQLLIVDHKKSSAGSRRDRMKAGWDLQIGLYRAMLLRPARRENDGLDMVIGHTPAMAYHTLNDGAVLQSGLRVRNQGADRVEQIVGDISGSAVELLAQRLAEVRSGRLRLNGLKDESFFKKRANLTPYAFDASPLVRLFMTEGGSLEDLTDDDSDFDGDAA